MVWQKYRKMRVGNKQHCLYARCLSSLLFPGGWIFLAELSPVPAVQCWLIRLSKRLSQVIPNYPSPSTDQPRLTLTPISIITSGKSNSYMYTLKLSLAECSWHQRDYLRETLLRLKPTYLPSGAVPKARPKGAQQHGCLTRRVIARMTCDIGEFVFVVQIE